MDKKQLGALGEKIAANYLKKKGYKILDRNFPQEWAGIREGELDIISKKDDIISFIEVKTAENGSLVASAFSPEGRVDFQKQRKLAGTAQIWLSKNKIPLDSKWQIDVISIELNLSSKKAKIKHLKNI